MVREMWGKGCERRKLCEEGKGGEGRGGATREG